MPAIETELGEMVNDVPLSVKELDKLPLYLMLMVVGGILAILLGILFGFIEFVIGGFSGVLHKVVGAIVTTMICFIGGFMLIVSFAICRKKGLLIGSLVAGVSCAILIAGGGVAGLIGGIIGIFGALLAFLKFLNTHQTDSPKTRDASAPQQVNPPPSTPPPPPTV